MCIIRPVGLIVDATEWCLEWCAGCCKKNPANGNEEAAQQNNSTVVNVEKF